MFWLDGWFLQTHWKPSIWWSISRASLNKLSPGVCWLTVSTIFNASSAGWLFVYNSWWVLWVCGDVPGNCTLLNTIFLEVVKNDCGWLTKNPSPFIYLLCLYFETDSLETTLSTSFTKVMVFFRLLKCLNPRFRHLIYLPSMVYINATCKWLWIKAPAKWVNVITEMIKWKKILNKNVILTTIANTKWSFLNLFPKCFWWWFILRMAHRSGRETQCQSMLIYSLGSQKKLPQTALSNTKLLSGNC